MVHVKEHMLLIGRSSPCSGGTDFLSHCLNGPLSYIKRHITINKNVLIASLKNIFSSFLSEF